VGLYAAFATLEHVPDEQRNVARQLVAQCPSHAPAWEPHARFLEDPSDKLAAIERGLLMHPDPDTRGSQRSRHTRAGNASWRWRSWTP
jgi:hypothetical protein